MARAPVLIPSRSATSVKLRYLSLIVAPCVSGGKSEASTVLESGMRHADDSEEGCDDAEDGRFVAHDVHGFLLVGWIGMGSGYLG